MTRTPRTTTTQMRLLVRGWPQRRLAMHRRWARETMREPVIPARPGWLASGPDIVHCARWIAVIRAEELRQAMIRRAA